ncbi:MAG: T9SS type A sorting domain-containing protein [bacterium]
MKRIYLLFIAFGFVFSTMAQLRPYMIKAKSDVKAPRPTLRIDDCIPGQQHQGGPTTIKSVLDDPNLMNSMYDMQTNAAEQNRFYLYPDGTMAGVATMAHTDNPFSDRGTGYNYFDGTVWPGPPAARIESVRTGWPSYAPLGPNGEIVVAHQSATLPLIISRRDTKGTGAWTQTELGPPTGASGVLWNRTVTNGADHNNVHIIAMTSPVANGGVAWNGLDGALIYNRSTDGGDTWDGWLQLDGMTSTEYLSFPGDGYAWAEPLGNTIAFTTGDSWQDQFLMKSTDNGDTWTKTLIWESLYNLWAGGTPTDTFYCPDGCSALALDQTGKAHLLFGLQRGNGDASGAKYFYPYTDGLIYWNEDMPELPQDLDPDTLFAHGNYIGWVPDTMIYYDGDLAYYYNSLSSFPTLEIDENNLIFAVWASVVLNLDPDNYLRRHLFARASIDGGASWRENIPDITDDFLYTWSECVFPFVAQTSDDKLYVLMQEDEYAGIYLRGMSGAPGQTAPTTNNMILLTPTKIEIIDPQPGINEKDNASFTVSQNYPNPVKDRTLITANLTKSGNLFLVITNVVGQKVLDVQKGNVSAGSHQFTIDGSQLNTGVYFYTVKVDNTSVTKKMIVE